MSNKLKSYSSDSILHSLWQSSVKLRNFKSKGGVITLLWEVCVLFLVFHSYSSSKHVSRTIFGIAVAFGVFFGPFAGWLADVHFGRYKIIKCCLWVLWLNSIMYGLTDVLVNVFPPTDMDVWPAISSTFLVVGLIGCGGFLVNIIQFGIDQLMDASSWEVSSYISWYCWTYFMTNGMNALLLTCVYPKLETLVSGFVAIVFTIALCTDFLFGKNHLIKEPTSSNPLKLIFQVLRYAVKNKYPRLRSPFSYWDEKRSRIDLAMTKYGGPFTTEQVEDVKAFLRMAAFIPVGSFFTGLLIVVMNTSDYMIFHYEVNNYEVLDNSSGYYQCLTRAIIKTGSSFYIILVIPFFEFVIYPLFWRCIMSITTMKKFLVGMCLLFINYVGLFSLEVAGHIMTSKEYVNHTVPCLLNSTENSLISHETLSLSFYWLAIPKIFSGIAYFLIFTSTVEFLCAQSPYSMKGLLIGYTYSTVAASVMVAVGLREPFRRIFVNPNHGRLSCGAWYFLFASVITGILIILTCILSKWYVRRRRRDNLQITENYHVQGCALENSLEGKP